MNWRHDEGVSWWHDGGVNWRWRDGGVNWRRDLWGHGAHCLSKIDCLCHQ